MDDAFGVREYVVVHNLLGDIDVCLNNLQDPYLPNISQIYFAQLALVL